MTKGRVVKGNLTKEEAKEEILKRFNERVRGKIPDVAKANSGHDGKYGHWLEAQMGVPHNRDNEPDLFGYEMKNHTRGKTTFGDWTADYYIYKNDKYFSAGTPIERRDKFMGIFGSPNPKKNNRHSWSGSVFPKITGYNECGQKMMVDKNNNILAIYSFGKDNRKNKTRLIPKSMQVNKLHIASWSAELMKGRVESKFNKLGWFKCIQNKEGVYTSIVFGKPINFTTWIEGVKNGYVYLDSGMHVGNNRPYSNWRAGNSYWESLVIDSH